MVERLPGDDLAVRWSLVADPVAAPSIVKLIYNLNDNNKIFDWTRRLMILPETSVDVRALRKALYAAGQVGVSRLKVFANSANRRDFRIGPFVSTVMLVNELIDFEKSKSLPVRLDKCRDYFEAAVAVVSEKVVPNEIGEIFDIVRIKNNIKNILSQAGFFKLKLQISYGSSVFIRRIRSNMYNQEMRGFTDQWTFAVGHMIILLFLLKGQNLELTDFRSAKIWKGEVANRFLWNRMFETSQNVEVVPKGSMFADNHDSAHLEWMGGRFVDYFEACGIIADRSGDPRGAVMDRPSLEDPTLKRFFEALGWRDHERFVTLHCREEGFRNVRRTSLRNVDVTAHLAAVANLVEQGYRVIRLGDPSMTPLPRMEGVFDYAVSPLKSEELDILLPGIARFHIGSSSGLSLVPLAFGTPCLFLNWHPFDLLPWGRRNWTVVKPIHASADGRTVIDLRAYASLGRVRDRLLLNSFGYDIRNLNSVEIERAVKAFAETTDLPEPPKEGFNRGRVLTVNDEGFLQDLV